MPRCPAARRGRRRSRRSGPRAGRLPRGTGWSAGRSRPRPRAPGPPPRPRAGCAGPGPCVGSSRKITSGRTDEAHREVEPAPHAAAVGGDAAVGGVGEVEALEQLVRARPAVSTPRSRAIIRRFSAPVSTPSTAASCAVRLIARAHGVRRSPTTSWPATRARAARRARAASRGCGRSSSCRRRSGRAARTPRRPRPAGRARRARGCRRRPSSGPRASIVYAIHRVYVIHLPHGKRPDRRSRWSRPRSRSPTSTGLAAVSMATVAKRCGFTTMSLYRHVASKDELVRRMLDEALGTAPALDVRRTGATGLEQWARAMLGPLERHPWGIDVPITGIARHVRAALLARPRPGGAGGHGARRRREGRARAAAQRLRVLGGAAALQVRRTAAEPLVPPEFDLEDAAVPASARRRRASSRTTATPRGGLRARPRARARRHRRLIAQRPRRLSRRAVARVVVVGSINVDLVVVVERLPAAGETVAGGRFAPLRRRQVANQAVAAARLGAAVAFVGAVGRRRDGREAVAELRGRGHRRRPASRGVDEPTGVALIVVDAAGENQIAVASGANAELAPPTPSPRRLEATRSARPGTRRPPPDSGRPSLARPRGLRPRGRPRPSSPRPRRRGRAAGPSC